MVQKEQEQQKTYYTFVNERARQYQVQVAGSIFCFSHDCYDMILVLMNVGMLQLHVQSFIYALVTPTYKKKSHNLCTKIQCVYTFHV